MTFHGDIDRLTELVKTHLNSGGSCHDFDHTLRVMHNAGLLLNHYPQADREIVMLSALLHDIARPEEDASSGRKCHAILGAEKVPVLLQKCSFPETLSAPVAAAVKSHRYRGKNEPETIEADIVFDADKLDSLGAVGLGRAFLFAGRLNARVHNTETEALNSESYTREDTAYREYLVKLRYLPRRMRTAAGRKIAVGRAAFMTAFFERMEQEINHGEI
ncbi:MAG: HD domain-containing protein [Lentisphaerae bacterium]|nr:HD domain-containing protein [Lentisphaerota bacterium]